MRIVKRGSDLPDEGCFELPDALARFVPVPLLDAPDALLVPVLRAALVLRVACTAGAASSAGVRLRSFAKRRVPFAASKGFSAVRSGCTEKGLRTG